MVATCGYLKFDPFEVEGRGDSLPAGNAGASPAVKHR